MTRWIALVLAALMLTGCGGSDGHTEGAVKFAGQMRTAEAGMPRQSETAAVTAEMTLDWAEYKFPDLFTKVLGVHFPSIEYLGAVYNARSYSGGWGTRYLGVTPDGRIFGLGDFTGEVVQQFNDIKHWAPQILAAQCNVNPDSCAAGGAHEFVLVGTVVIGPTCAGPRLPGQACSAPFAGAEVRLTDAAGGMVAQATTDSAGRFVLAARAGTYLLHAGGPGKLPHCPVLPVVLPQGAGSPLQLDCDSGIR